MVFRQAFTLIEVMVAVMIVSVVIAGIITLRGNSSTLLMHMQKEAKEMQYASFLPFSQEDGLQTAKTNLYRLSKEIDMDDDIRRKLKNTPVAIKYNKIRSYDTGDVTLEIGETRLKSTNFQISLKRITLQ